MAPNYNPDHLRNSEWISWLDLARRWRIRDFELINILKEGLQPYSENGLPLNCHMALHAHRCLSDEYSRIVGLLRKPKKQGIISSQEYVLPEEIKGERLQVSAKELAEWKKGLEDRKEKILTEMDSIEKVDPGLSSWKYFVSPSLEADLEEIIQELRMTLFRKEDVNTFELKLDLGPKKYIHSEKCRRQCRAFARKLLEEDSKTTKAHVIRELKRLNITKKPGSNPGAEKYYSDKVVRNWLKGLPFSRLARRPKLKEDAVKS